MLTDTTGQPTPPNVMEGQDDAEDGEEEGEDGEEDVQDSEDEQGQVGGQDSEGKGIEAGGQQEQGGHDEEPPNTATQPQPQTQPHVVPAPPPQPVTQLPQTSLPLLNGDGVTYDDTGRPRRFAPDGYWYHCFHANCSIVNRNAQEFSGRHLREWHTRDPTQTAEDIQRMLSVVTRARGFELQNEWLVFRNTQDRR